MLSECIARKDAVLSQDPKFVSEREKTYKNATMTYDLIALSLVRFNQVFQIFRQITTLSFDVSEFDDFFLSVQNAEWSPGAFHEIQL